MQTSGTGNLQGGASFLLPTAREPLRVAVSKGLSSQLKETPTGQSWCMWSFNKNMKYSDLKLIQCIFKSALS